MRISRDNLILGALFVLCTGLAAIAFLTKKSDIWEATGFVTGALGVWLTVKENIWNWPIGIVSSGIYIYVFSDQGLFADGGLQILYVALGFLGWYLWLFGGEKRSRLVINRTPRWEYPVLAVVTVAATWGLTVLLQSKHDSAPFWDALTSVVSIVAQYMVTRKYLENWHVWIAVDLVYVPLYISKGLYLTAILYFVFVVMAGLGLQGWLRLRRTLEAAQTA